MSNNISEHDKVLYAAGGALTGAAVGGGTAYLCKDKLYNSKNFLTRNIDAFVLSNDSNSKALSKKHFDLLEELNKIKDKAALKTFLVSKNINNIPQSILKEIDSSCLDMAKSLVESNLEIDFYHAQRKILRQIPEKKFHNAYILTFALLGAAVLTPLVCLIHNNKNKNN